MQLTSMVCWAYMYGLRGTGAGNYDVDSKHPFPKSKNVTCIDYIHIAVAAAVAEGVHSEVCPHADHP